MLLSHILHYNYEKIKVNFNQLQQLSGLLIYTTHIMTP